MAPTIDNPPLPGTWVKPAQEALDTLSTMATIEKVADEFGAARAIAVAVLGAPAAGGSATRPTIWATGHLLTHRLGPALAAEALSWAASVEPAYPLVTVRVLEDTELTYISSVPTRTTSPSLNSEPSVTSMPVSPASTASANVVARLLIVSCSQ